MARILGIDLGSHSVKVAVFQGGFGKLELQQVLMAPVEAPPDGVSLLIPQADALEGLLASLPEEGRSVAGATFPAEHAGVRLVTLPFGERDQVERTLPFEVENLVPFDLEDMVLASRTLSVEPGRSQVLTALAARAELGPRLAALAGAGADPRFCILDADLLGSVAGDGVTAVVDLGHSRTLVALAEDGHVLTARAITGGGRALTEALAAAHAETFAEAELRKHSADIYADAPARSAAEVEVELVGDETTDVGRRRNTRPDDGQVLRDALVPLLSEVRASLLAFEDSLEREVESVVLVGGTAQLDGLCAWLEAILGVPVGLATVPDETGVLQATEEPRFVLAHAAGVKAGTGKGRSLDFRKDEYSFRGDLAYFGTVLRVAAAAAVLFLVGGVAWFGYQSLTLSSTLASLDDQIRTEVVEALPTVDPDSLTSGSKAKAVMLEKLVEATTRVDALGSILSDEPPTWGLLAEISRRVPAGDEATLDVTELSISPTNIVLKAETDGYEQAAKIEAALQRSDRFKQASKGDEQKKRDKVRFTITIPLDDEGEQTDEG